MAKRTPKWLAAGLDLPALDHTPGESAKGQLRIAELKAEITDTNPIHLAKQWFEADEAVEKLEADLAEAKRKKTAIGEVLADTLEAEDLTTIKHAVYGPVSVRYKPYISIVNPLQFRHHCVSVWIPNGVIHETELVLHAGRASSLIEGLLEHGQPVPPGAKAWMRKKLHKA